MNPLLKNLNCLGLGKGVVSTGRPTSMSRKFIQVMCYGLITTLLSGCMTQQRTHYDVQEMPLPDQYKNIQITQESPKYPAKKSENSTQVMKPNASQEVGLVEWWRAFGSTELVELIDRGLANNPDVRIATEQMAQAKTRVDQARAGLLPTLSAPIEIGGGTISPGVSNLSSKTFQASLRGDWRPDLWGERSSIADSAKFMLWQSSFNRDNVQRNMVASLAASYVEYLSLNDRLRVAHETDTVLNRMLSSVEKRVAAGDATMIELDQQKASIFAVRSTIPTLEQQREEALSTMAFMVGSVRESLILSNAGLDSLYLPSIIPALPSSLLLRRPDVRMAEARLLSADADIDVARARLLPPLDLSGQLGHNSLALAEFLQPSALFWNAVSTLTVSIFDGGKLKSDKENAQAIHEEMVETYARTIYQATREVESALATIRLTSNRLASQQDATTAARLAWDTSAKVYSVGGLDYQSLLDTERNYHNYLNQYLQVKTDTYHGYITLFQALGGGVNFVKPTPGKGIRPTSTQSASSNSATPTLEALSTEGIDWAAGNANNAGNPPKIETFWQIELPGLYHRSTISATWRDLRTRYPRLMESRVIRPRINGKTDSNLDEELYLFRLYISKFSTPEDAHDICEALKANFQRCRVVSSISDDEVPEPPFSKIIKESSPATTTPKATKNIAVETKTKNEPVPVKAEPALSALPKTQTESQTQSAPVAAKKTAAVNNEEISVPQNKPKDKLAYTIQLGAFSNIENAAVSHAFWHAKDYDVYVAEIKDTEGETRFVVRTGAFQTKGDALASAGLFKRKEDKSATVVQTALNKSGTPESIDISKLSPQGTPHSPLVAASITPEPAEPSDEVQKLTEMQKPAFNESTHESVTVQSIGKAKPAYSIELGSFATEGIAVKAQEKWQTQGLNVFICEIRETSTRTRYSVRTGVFTELREASDEMRSLKRKVKVQPTLVTDVARISDKPVSNGRHLSETTRKNAFNRPV